MATPLVTPSSVSVVASPCVGFCQLDENGERCLGCGRTMAEITAWGVAVESEKSKKDEHSLANAIAPNA